MIHHIPLWFAAKYGMRLSRPCLSICHYHTIEAVQNVLDNGARHLLVGLGLLASFVENVVKEEISIFVILAQK